MNAGPTDSANNNEGDDTGNGSTDASQFLQPITTKQMAENDPYHEVNDFLAQQRPAKAQQAFNALSSNVQHTLEGVVAQAKIYLAENKNVSALQLLESYNGVDESSDYYAVYAAALTFNKQYSQAVSVYKKLVEYWPDNPNWW